MSNNKLEIDIDSTCLSTSACERNFFLTVIGSIEDGKIVGGYKSPPNAAMIYGVAVHKFIDTMYKTAGHYPTAKTFAETSFNVPKVLTDEKKQWLLDPKHLITSCYNLWTNYIEEDSNFELLDLPVKCFWCFGKGQDKDIPCKYCQGKGVVNGKASELTFRILIYDDAFIKVNLCGTIDRVGKFHNGCYAIGDWKTTSAYNKDSYLSSYELSRQLRIYVLACKMMAQMYPDSILGKVGSTNMGAFIDGVFLKSKANDNEYQRSQVFQFSNEDMCDFRIMVDDFCRKLSESIQHNYWPKAGILNGSCDAKFGKCRFWNVCKSNETVGNLLLNRDFKRVIYNPLKFNE